MDIGAEPYVVGQVPTVMDRILIDRDLVAIPEPVVAEGVVVWVDSKREAVKPEALPVSSPQPKDVAAAKSAREAPVLPEMIEVIVGIVAAGVVSDPAAIGVDVRNSRMPRLIAKSAIPRGRGRSGCRSTR